jgi:L-amino acid N-acyltransferase YncA
VQKELIIREVSVNDARAICDIYNYYIENTVITFETVAISEAGMKQRIKEMTDSGFPFYVGEDNSKVIGYCYAHTWNYRHAYSTTNEVTVYLDRNETGKGYGYTLYEHLIGSIDRKRIHVLIAGICIPNERSVRLHEKFGFRQVSCMKEIGRKFDQWRDVGHWQLCLE